MHSPGHSPGAHCGDCDNCKTSKRRRRHKQNVRRDDNASFSMKHSSSSIGTDTKATRLTDNSKPIEILNQFLQKSHWTLSLSFGRQDSHSFCTEIRILGGIEVRSFPYFVETKKHQDDALQAAALKALYWLMQTSTGKIYLQRAKQGKVRLINCSLQQGMQNKAWEAACSTQQAGKSLIKNESVDGQMNGLQPAQRQGTMAYRPKVLQPQVKQETQFKQEMFGNIA